MLAFTFANLLISRMNAMECNSLTRQFGDFKAVNGISLSAREGEIFGFLDTNDAGKAIVIRIFCGLSYSTSGQTCAADFDVYTQ